jgi:nucleoid DNA-binding protein
VEKSQSSIDSDKLKGVLITRTAIKALVAEDIVEKVISFQFKDLKEMTSSHEQIELGGFGKFMTSPNKIARRISKLESKIRYLTNQKLNPPEGTTEKRLLYWTNLLKHAEERLAELKTKKGGYENKS